MTFHELVAAELEKARRKHPTTYPSAHYFYGVIAEEVDEFWDLVKAQTPSREEMLKELVQIGAMAQRAAEDIGLIPNAVNMPTGLAVAMIGESIYDFYRRADPDKAEEGLANLRDVHQGKVPAVIDGETLAAYFHRTDPL